MTNQFEKSRPPKILPTIGMMTSLTSESTILPNAPPMMNARLTTAAGTIRSDTLPLVPRRRDRIAPVLSEAARRDPDAHRRLTPLVFIDLDEANHLAHVFRRKSEGDDFSRTLVLLD